MAKPTKFNQHFRGRLGDLVFYEIDGRPVCRRVGRIDPKKRKESANFESVRQNNKEFALASSLGKVIRQPLLPFKDVLFDASFSGRLTGKLRVATGRGRGPVGKRWFEVQQLEVLHMFPLNGRQPRKAFFATGHYITIDDNDGSVSLKMTISDLESLFWMKVKEFHKVILGGIAVSEVHYEGGYKITHPDWHGQSAFAQVEGLDRSRPETMVEITAGLETNSPLPNEVRVIGLIAIL